MQWKEDTQLFYIPEIVLEHLMNKHNPKVNPFLFKKSARWRCHWRAVNGCWQVKFSNILLVGWWNVYTKSFRGEKWPDVLSFAYQQVRIVQMLFNHFQCIDINFTANVQVKGSTIGGLVTALTADVFKPIILFCIYFCINFHTNLDLYKF